MSDTDAKIRSMMADMPAAFNPDKDAIAVFGLRLRAAF